MQPANSSSNSTSSIQHIDVKPQEKKMTEALALQQKTNDVAKEALTAKHRRLKSHYATLKMPLKEPFQSPCFKPVEGDDVEGFSLGQPSETSQEPNTDKK